MLGKLFSKSVPQEGVDFKVAGPVSTGGGNANGKVRKGEVHWLSNLRQKRQHEIPHIGGTVCERVRNRLYFSGTRFNGFQYMDLETLTMTRISGGDLPKHYEMHTMTAMGDRIAFCGGVISHPKSSSVEIEVFNTVTETTTVEGEFPPLMQHSTEYSPERDALVVFGGVEWTYDDSEEFKPKGRALFDPLAGVQKFATNTTRLVFMKEKGLLEEKKLHPSGRSPRARYNHKSAFLNEQLFIFNGRVVLEATGGDMHEHEQEQLSTPLFVLDLRASDNGDWSHVNTGMEWYSDHKLNAYNGMVVILGGDTMSQPDELLEMYLPEEKRIIKARSKRYCRHKGDSRNFARKGRWPYFNHIDFSYVYNDMIHYFQPFEKRISRVRITLPDPPI